MTDNQMVQGHSSKHNLAEDERRVVSEDANAGMASPIMDLVAAMVIAAISIFIAAASLALPVPGRIFTAPGLLPFLTAASLMVMSLILGYTAVVRRRTTPRALDRFEVPEDYKRSLVLGGIVILYVLALQVIPIELTFSIGSLHFVIGAFETVSLVVITGLLKLYWRAPLWACLSVTVGWIAFLSIVFRMLFQTPLP